MTDVFRTTLNETVYDVRPAESPCDALAEFIRRNVPPDLRGPFSGRLTRSGAVIKNGLIKVEAVRL